LVGFRISFFKFASAVKISCETGPPDFRETREGRAELGASTAWILSV
jgi:hypothetical protein